VPKDAARIVRAFAPIEPARARLLILGSVPGVASLDADAYYAHPRNAFWPVMQALLGATATTYPARIALLKSHGIALWDVLQECDRPGSLDSNIRHETIVCNDIPRLLARHPAVLAIAFNGKTAERLFRHHLLPAMHTAPELLSLPSTSPAMASLSLAQKTQRWRHTDRTLTQYATSDQKIHQHLDRRQSLLSNGTAASFAGIALTLCSTWHRLWRMSMMGGYLVSEKRFVRLFRNGRNQAVRIPREFELDGDEAIIKKEGDRLILEPVRKGHLLETLARLQPINESFADIDDDLPGLDEVDL